MTHNRNMGRHGYTLVELLVAMFILVALAALAALIIPKVQSDQTATRAGTQVQQWLLIAKQRALRNRAPRGLRLLPGNPASPLANPLLVTDVEYLEQPDDFHLGNQEVTAGGVKYLYLSRATIVTTVTGGVTAPLVVTTTVLFDLFSPRTPVPGNPNPKTNVNQFPRTLTGRQNNANLFPVQVGDSIIFNEGGPAYLITAISSAGPNAHKQLTISAPVLPPANLVAGQTTTMQTMQYRIIRKPRSVGDEPLQLPANAVIDLTAKNALLDPAVRTPNYDLTGFMSATNGLDIMFAPDGRVMGNLAGLDKIILWVRDPAQKVKDGGPTLVCIYPRTGLIAAHPVDTGNLDAQGNPLFPYTFTMTGRRSSE